MQTVAGISLMPKTDSWTPILVVRTPVVSFFFFSKLFCGTLFFFFFEEGREGGGGGKQKNGFGTPSFKILVLGTLL